SIGARTAESQTHRELASALPLPVGVKNPTSGDLDVAVNAMTAVSRPHHMLGLSASGAASVRHSPGNPDRSRSRSAIAIGSTSWTVSVPTSRTWSRISSGSVLQVSRKRSTLGFADASS
ncbi:MAG: hypothetical protein GY910_21015, partial [bacterium]|nr:hypothetical protein [bacterium]